MRRLRHKLVLKIRAERERAQAHPKELWQLPEGHIFLICVSPRPAYMGPLQNLEFTVYRNGEFMGYSATSLENALGIYYKRELGKASWEIEQAHGGFVLPDWIKEEAKMLVEII
jgi:hypothetical protein